MDASDPSLAGGFHWFEEADGFRLDRWRRAHPGAIIGPIEPETRLSGTARPVIHCRARQPSAGPPESGHGRAPSRKPSPLTGRRRLLRLSGFLFVFLLLRTGRRGRASLGTSRGGAAARVGSGRGSHGPPPVPRAEAPGAVRDGSPPAVRRLPAQAVFLDARGPDVRRLVAPDVARLRAGQRLVPRAAPPHAERRPVGQLRVRGFRMRYFRSDSFRLGGFSVGSFRMRCFRSGGFRMRSFRSGGFRPGRIWLPWPSSCRRDRLWMPRVPPAERPLASLRGSRTAWDNGSRPLLCLGGRESRPCKPGGPGRHWTHRGTGCRMHRLG